MAFTATKTQRADEQHMTGVLLRAALLRDMAEHERQERRLRRRLAALWSRDYGAALIEREEASQ